MCNLINKLNSKILDSRNRVSSTKLLKLIRDRDPYYKKLLEVTRFLPEATEPIERYHCVRLGYTSRQLCECGKPVNFNKAKKIYNEFCSKDCECKKNKQILSVKSYYSRLSKTRIKNINSLTKFLPAEASITERIYCLENNIMSEKDLPRCACGNSVNFNGKTYNKFCPNRCLYFIKHFREKGKETVINTYGTDNVFKLPKFQNKARQEILNIYGTDNVFKLTEFQDKAKKKWLEKRGVSNPGQCPKVKKKIENTNIKKRGVRSVLSDREIRLKIERTNIKKYGNKMPMKTEKVKNKLRKTLALKNRRRILKSQRHLPEKVIRLRKNKNLYRDLLEIWHNDLKLMQVDIAEHLGVKTQLIQNDFKKLGVTVKLHYTSKFEKEIKTYIENLKSIQIESRYKLFGRSKELDLYIPELKIAVEANGNFWHSYDHVPSKIKQYNHFFKTDFCRKEGIRLFHIFQSDWDCAIKGEIWRSILKTNIIGANRKIYARDTKVVPLTFKKANEFFTETHLQGNARSTLYLGLSLKDEIVMAMSFTKTRTGWSLNRMSTKLDTQVIGGASKLFKNFVKIYNPEEVVTFADLMYSYGDVYPILGFDLVSQNPPKHYYTDGKAIIHCRNFQKSKLKKILGRLYEPDKTEKYNVLKHTTLRILWDSGKLKFSWKK